MKLLSRLYYEKATGNCITITEQRNWIKQLPTKKQDLITYKALIGYKATAVDYIELPYDLGKYKKDFATGKCIGVDLKTKEPIFDYTQDKEITKQSINQMVITRIRTKYTVDDEFQMQRLGLINKDNAEYKEYAKYVNECLKWGRKEKEKV